MHFKDRFLNCDDCGREFVFRVEEQRRMASDGDVVEPRLCPGCRVEKGEKGRLVGHVKWFDPSRGYGFIKRDDGRGEVFVHRSQIQYAGPKVLYEDERVEFELEHDPRGEKAVNVTGHDPFVP